MLECIIFMKWYVCILLKALVGSAQKFYIVNRLPKFVLRYKHTPKIFSQMNIRYLVLYNGYIVASSTCFGFITYVTINDPYGQDGGPKMCIFSLESW